MVVTTLATLGIILGGMIALKDVGFPMDAVYAFMALCFVIGAAVVAALIWQIARLNGGAARAGGALPRMPVTDTGRLDATYAAALPEPAASVTEDTTRRLQALRSRETQ
jgi:hypothetical protein